MNIRNNKSIILSVFLAAVFFFALVSGATASEDLSGNTILKNVDDKSQSVTQGEMISIINFHNVNADGTESSYRFGALARKKSGEPNRTLIYYLKPQYVRGSIFLSKDAEEGETKMWLYLSALGQKKELSASKKESSFAGSTISYEEIGSWSMSEEYNAEIAEETTVQVGDQSVSAYKMNLTAKERADPQYPKQTIWVGKNNWVLLHSKNYNSQGELVKEMEVKQLTTFEKNTVTKELVTTAVDSGASTTVTYVKRERPEQDIPNSVFEAENLKNFDPAKWGLME